AGTASVLADAAEVDPQGSQLTVEVRALHADSLGELPDFTVTKEELLLQVGTLELLAGLAQRQRQKILFYKGLSGRRLDRELALDLLQANFLGALLNQEAVHQVLQLADIVRPRIVTQSVLRRNTEAPEGQPFGVDDPIHVVSQQLGNIFRVIPQRRGADNQHV